MKIMIIIFTLVTLQNMASASNNDFAAHFNLKSVEYRELSSMDASQSETMKDCVDEAMNDQTVMEVDHYEATSHCINEVLGDIHN